MYSEVCDYLYFNNTVRVNLNNYTLCISITATLWEVSVEAIAEVVDDSHKKNLSVYTRLRNTLNSLKDFYYCDGAGVSGQALDSEAYSVRYYNKITP